MTQDRPAPVGTGDPHHGGRRRGSWRGSSDDTPVALIRPIQPGEIAGADDLVDFGTEDGPGRRRWRIVRRSLFAIAAIVVAYYAFNLVHVYLTGRSDQADSAAPVDAIVVLGAAQYDGDPSPQLAGRLDHVLTLYERGVAPLIVVTGGKQPSDRFTEAEASAIYLADRGVPADAIVMETTGRTTYESLEGTSALLEQRGLRRIMVVTDPYHALRSRMIAEEVGLTAYVSPTPNTVVRGGEAVRRHLIEAGGVAIGRLVGFENL